MRACPKCGATYPDNVQFCPTDGSALGPEQTEQGRDPRLGTLIDRYRLVEKLGEGGMGVVYRAEHTLIGRPVALKLLHPDLARVPEAVDRFFREARAANEIASDHIVQVTDFGRAEDGANFLVMEFLEGTSLARLVKEQGRLSPAEAARIGLQLAEGLAAAHAKGVIHRDLKPGNIQLVERSGDPRFVKIMDFGIAKIAESGTQLTKTGAILGSPAYMSPEQASGKPIDHRTDVYALGVIIYEMLCGRPPFEGTSPTQILVAHVTQSPSPPRSVQADVPEPLEALVLQCLAKEAGARPQGMEAVASRLEAWLQGQPSGPIAIAPTVAAPVQATPSATLAPTLGDASVPPTLSADPVTRGTYQVAPQQPGRRGMVIAIIAAAVLLAGGAAVGAVLLLRDTPKVEFGAASGTGSSEQPVKLAAATPADAAPAPSPEPDAAPPAPDSAAATAQEPPETAEPPETPDAPETPATHRRPAATVKHARWKAPPEPTPQPTPKPAPPRRVLLDSVPQGADVYRGKQHLGRTPLQISVGEAMTLALAMRGYKARYVRVPADSGPLRVTLQQDLPEYKRTKSLSRVKDLYRAGQITKDQYRARSHELKGEIRYQVELIVRRYKRGEISRAERRELVKQLKDSYR